ncbi:branched-chain amino acid ABC transporter permease [Nonomuraea phyllanthi]|uniref:Branched-chain amino acid ABC transporter permease n=1 Tax=Nonomuraea phyllanthi TaxID=2219224 RepID=A0A5C4WT82_9ACTN|nr:branched-chain amino acid ABC transporter permease [Nonomuraea phyllanthi]QFY14174.1 branched-chain amino acid ABC transporter permease [Nonomuraea phyllanthi]
MAGALVAVVTLALPAVLADSALAVYILLGLAAMVTVGVSLLMGYAGQVSLGQGAFYAIGAYTAALLALHGVPPVIGLVAAPVAAAGFALVIGVPLLRLRGHHLAFATLAMQLILLSLAGQLEFTGGDIGLQAIPQFSAGSFEAGSALAYAYLTWAGLALVMLVTRNVIRSRPGRALRALATSETAAASSGIPVGRYKLVVFALSAAFAGLAGGIYCFYTGYVAPGSFPVLISIQYIVMAVVGGLGTIWGAVAGAAAITLLVQGLNSLAALPGMPSYAPGVLSYAVYALVLVLVVLFLPRGLLPAVTGRLRRDRPPVETR